MYFQSMETVEGLSQVKNNVRFEAVAAYQCPHGVLVGHSISSKQMPHSPSMSSRGPVRVGDSGGASVSVSEDAPSVLLPFTSSLLIVNSTCETKPPLQSLQAQTLF